MESLIFKGDRCFPPARGRVSFDRVELKPGLNELSDEFATALKEHPDYPRYSQWGAIEWIAPITEVTLPGDSPNDLSTYSADDAQRLIATCFSEDTLRGWLEKERRTTVVRAINRRIQEVKEGN